MTTFPKATVNLPLPGDWAARFPRRGPVTVRFFYSGSAWEAIVHGTLVRRLSLLDAMADARSIAYGPSYPLDAAGYGGEWSLSPAILRLRPTL